MKKTLIVVLCFISLSVFALSLNEAKQKGLVKELPTGFLKATDASANSLASEINAKRRSVYKKVAKKTGASVEAVAAQAAKKIQD